MGFLEGVSLSVVLGRLFKLHPKFDEVLAGILISSPENSLVVLISEKINDWNEVIYDRIYNHIINLLNSTYSIDNDISITSNYTTIKGLHLGSSKLSPPHKLITRADLIIKKLRFLNYDYYGDLLRAASVVLDTFPYGGTFLFSFYLFIFIF